MTQFQKRHYESIARTLKGAKTKGEVSSRIVRMLEKDNPRFNRQQFIKTAKIRGVKGDRPAVVWTRGLSSSKPLFQRRHREKIARILRESKSKGEVMKRMTNMFARDNQNFDAYRFRKRLGGKLKSEAGNRRKFNGKSYYYVGSNMDRHEAEHKADKIRWHFVPALREYARVVRIGKGNYAVYRRPKPQRRRR